MDTNVTFREYRPETDSEPVRVLLNQIFSSAVLDREAWDCWTASDFTAPVAELAGEIIGAIPLKRREYKVGAEGRATAWVEHRVGVAETYRALGVGSGMQTCAKSFLLGRGDVLLVYRGAERSAGYLFYEKNGLHDVTYIRSFSLAPESSVAPPTGMEVAWLSPSEFLAGGPQWHAIFSDCFAARAGYPIRSANYLSDLVKTGLWRRAMQHDFAYAVASRAGTPVGYALIGELAGSACLMELAAMGAQLDVAVALIGAAFQKGQSLSARVQDGSLVAKAFTALGAGTPPRERGCSSIMVHVLDPESTFRHVLGDVPALRDVELRFWTPERDGVLRCPRSSARTVTIELKEHMLSRLLMRRLDVATAVTEERITLHGAQPGDVQALAAALCPAPWTTCRLDYL